MPPSDSALLDFPTIDSVDSPVASTRIGSVEFQLDHLIENIADLVDSEVGEKGLDLMIHQSRDVPERMIGCPLHLGQTLLNLMQFAVTFTQAGEVVLSVSAVQRDQASVLVKFQVRDTAVDMPAHVRDHLFKTFNKAGAPAEAGTTAEAGATTPSRRFGRIGMGLLISQQLVRRMGGTLKLDSRERRGNTFSFELRLGIVKDTAEPSSALASADALGPLPHTLSVHELAALTRARILVVDDNAINRELLMDMLQRLGVTITLARNGRVALERLETDTFDCVLMDGQMPELDGYETTRWLRCDPRWQNLPVIAITANTMPQDRDDAIAAGMNDYLAKPFSFPDLAAKLARWVRPLPEQP